MGVKLNGSVHILVACIHGRVHGLDVAEDHVAETVAHVAALVHGERALLDCRAHTRRGAGLGLEQARLDGGAVIIAGR